MDKLGANFRGIEGKMQSLLKKDEKETNSETSSLKFENNKRNDQIVQVNNQQHSAPSENMTQNYDLEEEYRNLRPQRYPCENNFLENNIFLVAEDLVVREKNHVIVQGNHVKRDYLEV